MDQCVVLDQNEKVEGERRSPGLGVLLIHPLLGLLEQAHGLLGLVAQVLHEDAKVLVVPQDLHLAFVAGQDGAKVLVGVGQQVQDVRGTVLQRYLGILTQAHHLNSRQGGRTGQSGWRSSPLLHSVCRIQVLCETAAGAEPSQLNQSH